MTGNIAVDHQPRLNVGGDAAGMKATMKPEKASSDFSFDIVIANVSVEFVNFEHHYPRLAFGMSFGSTSLEPVLGFAGFSRCIEARPGRFV